MAVYTQLSKEQIDHFLTDYDVGTLVSFDGILQGVENTNYKIVTTEGNYILTAFERRTNELDLPFFFDFMNHLSGKGIYCPHVIRKNDGTSINRIAGKASALISFLGGHNVDVASINGQACYEVGVLVARMHLAAQDFNQVRPNSMSLPVWKNLYKRIEFDADKIAPGLSNLMRTEITLAEKTLALDLPKTVVHADIFPDNVFVVDGHVKGVIDFYFSATDFMVYDLAITVNAWAFFEGSFNLEFFTQLIDGYNSVREITLSEKRAFQNMARAAALRILMTRSNDWLFHDPNNMVMPKSPLDYKRILEFHRNDQIFS